MWILIVIVGHLLNAVAFLIDKYLLTKQVPNPILYSFLIGLLGLVAFVLTPFGLEILPQHEMILSLFSGAAFVLALYFFFASLKKADASRAVTLIGALQPILIFGLAFWWLGERLGGMQIFAFGLLMVGGIIIGWEKTSVGTGFKPVPTKVRWIHHAFLAVLFFSISFVLVKDVFTDANFISGLVWSRLGGAIMAGIYLLVPRARRNILGGFQKTEDKKKAGSLVLVSQVGGALGFVLVTYAVSLASVTLVAAMQGIQYAFLFLMVAFMTWKFPKVLRERMNKAIVLQKIAAILIISAGLAVLAL